MKKLIICIGLALALIGCDKPETITVKEGEPCHESDAGWKQCGEDLICMKDDVLEFYKDGPVSENAAPTSTHGSNHGADQDCYGFMNDKCITPGKCLAKAKIGEFCVNDKMCLEGKCIHTTRDNIQTSKCAAK